MNKVKTVNIAEGLEQGVEYMIKFTHKKRRVRMTFEKVTRNYESETVWYPVMEFHSASQGCIWSYDVDIEDIKLAVPLKPKQKKGITCTRCLGNKVYEKFSHINGGRCFKCDGTGII